MMPDDKWSGSGGYKGGRLRNGPDWVRLQQPAQSEYPRQYMPNDSRLRPAATPRWSLSALASSRSVLSRRSRLEKGDGEG